MKTHVLCQYSEVAEKVESPYVIYDFLSQVSYYDSKCTRKVIDFYKKLPISTVMTEQVEHSDADNLLLFGSTIETRGTENSDRDNIWVIGSTTTTFSTENTDKDN